MPRKESSQRFVTGARLYLRDVRIADAKGNYLRWMNDLEVTRYLESRFYPASQAALEEYIATIRNNRDNFFFAMVVNRTERHIGNIKVGPVNWIHRVGDIGLLIGEKDCWGKGFATEAIGLVVQFAFDSLNLHKLTASCYSSNVGSIRAFERAGFAREGIRKQQFHSNGRYVDQVMLGMVRQEGIEL